MPELLDKHAPSAKEQKALARLGKTITDERLTTALQATESTGRDYIRQAILCGALLTAAKEATPHGEWMKRLQSLETKSVTHDRFAPHHETAKRYMRLWRHFARDQDEARSLGSSMPDAAESVAMVVQEDGDSLLAISRAISDWIGDDDSINAILRRIGKAAREVHNEEEQVDPDPKPDPTDPKNLPGTYDQTTFFDKLIARENKHSIVSQLRNTIHNPSFAAAPRRDWMAVHAEIHPIYEEICKRAGL